MMLTNQPAIDLLKSLSRNSVDLVLIDPPYLTTNKQWDIKEAVTKELAYELKEILKPTGNLYCWCGIGEKSQSLIRWFPLFSSFLTFKDLITWKKRRGIGMRRGWLYTREELMWFVKDNKLFQWNKEFAYSEEPNQFKVGMGGYPVQPFKRISNVWTDIPEFLGDKQSEHYTPKPLEALKRIIQSHTSKGQVVLDCFMGSGSTGVAALQLGRDFIGCEIDKETFDYASKQIAYHGKEKQ